MYDRRATRGCPLPARESVETAVFGGSFDPPHCAHVMAVAYVLSCTPCRQAVIVPTFRHAFDKTSSPFAVRLAMCRAAFAPFGRRVRVLDVERRLPAPSYTVQTLRHLRELHPDWRPRLVIGTDILPETPRWHDFDAVARLAPPIVLARGAPHPDARGPVFPAVSSTALRQAIRERRPVDDLIPEPVLDIIRREGLYRD